MAFIRNGEFRVFFTKTLDLALLNKIDIAVHSLKDVPTQLPVNLKICAISKRTNIHDVLVYKDPSFQLSDYSCDYHRNKQSSEKGPMAE
ncbi:MAG: hypothetical protein U0X76_05195 [Bacteroidia bacterium]